MISRDNLGNIVSEYNVVRTNDGRTVTTNTVFYSNQPVAQTISIRGTRGGRVQTTNLVGGKLLP